MLCDDMQIPFSIIKQKRNKYVSYSFELIVNCTKLCSNATLFSHKNIIIILILHPSKPITFTITQKNYEIYCVKKSCDLV